MADFLGRFMVLTDTSSAWAAANPILLNGELAVADEGSSAPILKVGDGVRNWAALPSITAGGGGGGSADYVAGSTTTLPPGSAATVVIDNSVDPPTISFGIPAGVAGPAGAAGAPGAAGAAGPPNSLAIGTVTTGAPGSPAAASITGTPPAQTLSLTIPQGDVGATGATGATGPTGATGATGPPGPSAFANPTALVGLAPINGVSNNAIRADGAPALNQAIAPTWTGAHVFNASVDLAGVLKAAGAEGISGQVLSSQGPGLSAAWRTASGGSIELGYNFNSSTAAANPGAQKLALNAAAFTGVTAIYINITAFTNFDASTILSLLQTGNRIYIQQRNDASKAAVFQVTGAATNNTGWWTVPVIHVNSLGTPWPNNADLNAVFILSTSASASANPTASVGLAAVNGVATTWMRSDAAPPLSQAIAPTWTAAHVFGKSGGGSAAAIQVIATQPSIVWREGAQTADEQKWQLDANGKHFRGMTVNGADSAVSLWVDITRGTGTAITNIAFGNATDNPTYSFFGTGLTTFAGPVSITNAGLPLTTTNTVSGPAAHFNSNYAQGAYIAFQRGGVTHGYIGNGAVLVASGVTDSLALRSETGLPIVFATAGNVEVARFTTSGAIQITGGFGAGFRSAAGLEMGVSGSTAFIQGYNRAASAYLGLRLDGLNVNVSDGASQGDLLVGGRHSLTNLNDTFLRLNSGSEYSGGVTTPGAMTASSFTTSSERALKRETGAPSRVADMLARLRPILYRLLGGNDREQLGLIAEEVREVCPQLSDGATVAYDRLAILLLAAWQEQHAAAA